MTQESSSRTKENTALLAEVQALLAGLRPDEDAFHDHERDEDSVNMRKLVKLGRKLDNLSDHDIADVLEKLSEDDRLLTWGQVREERADCILMALPDEIRTELVGDSHLPSTTSMLNAFELRNGRLRQIPVENPGDFADLKPIWVDLVAPDSRVLDWVGSHFGLTLPDPSDLTDLEASARFYVEDNEEVHLHSDFLLDTRDVSRNVPVAFILHKDILFSVRSEELPVFRLQRLRARAQPGYVSDGKDVLLDLYAADAEYSADALEDVYAELEKVGRNVLNKQLTDEEAGKILADIAGEEDLNGLIRRNILDSRRALSFLIRGKFLSSGQREDAREIIRDIESIDGHTSFLFGKINFLMDATVGFININQNNIIKRLTVLSVIFMPLNLLAGIGGMSEFTMMSQGIPWPISYLSFGVGLGIVGYFTYVLLRRKEHNQIAHGPARKRS